MKGLKFLVAGVILAIGLVLFVSIGPGKYMRREYGQAKLSLTSNLSRGMEQVVLELTSTASENRASLLEKYVPPTLPQGKKSELLRALETLANSKEYHLSSVHRYGERFIKAVFSYSGPEGTERQMPFLLVEEKNQLFFLEIP